ncbi:NAD(P)/FAD-dependent oxidoreductase [Amycolatopsis tucumanensis]|uniref:FAD-dependent oxidoreductase n=1 Tax=Amycolatopsis tucumanensis TaxID=401106 RepID=A0ABP7IVK2_9PSEU|nr:FAD-dependent oxidoreductase [Amycolatopsis tucumanensis]MCF6424167.1 FAD-dependent oxidoreductase [Amycolatopsis tucumanensis]
MTASATRLRHIAVVGASLAGAVVADTLRRNGYDGRITLLGAEPHAAYSRPALSKGVLAGTEEPGDIALQPLGGDIDQRLNTRVVAADLQARRLVLDDGDDLAFDGLAITTGARARRLADLGAAEPGARETTFRDLDDALWLARELRGHCRVVIVGAGILGMELASACVDHGAEVTIVDRQPPLLAQLGEYLADLVAAAARRAGVRFVCHPSIRLRGVTSPIVELGDGRQFEGDIILSAVGCTPNVEWLAGTGLPARGGVQVDARGRVRENIVAAGDVAAFPADDGYRRTPLWNSALEQARTAAAALLHRDAAPPLNPAGYFWTEQFGLTIKVCGKLPAAGTPDILDGTPGTSELLLQWRDERSATTAAAVNTRVPIGKLRALSRAS